MASDVFLKIDGIKGESQDDKFKDQIELLNYAHGVSQPVSAVQSSAGGGTTGRCDHQPLSVTKFVDTATPLLAQHCCSGKHIKEVILTLCRSAGDEKIPYMTYTLTDVVISSDAVSGAGEGDLPTEHVTFDYAKINWEYTQQKRKGGGSGGVTTGGWDLAKNKIA